jgi:molybdenum-dependent DNA-binding transcriptional regulator ModE
MKRSSALNVRTQQDHEYLPDTAHNSNKEFLEDPNSPYLSNNNGLLSDSDSLSDSSRKIRKKRNTYSKISDDIRVLLLEAVQNGETLKSAAKRHKINYSSAKSILHTYRKEGRILKKSAQERTTKKKPEASSETNTPQKPVKSSKKENMQPTLTNPGMSVEKVKSQVNNQSASFNTESVPLACIQGLNDNSSTLKSNETHGKSAGDSHFHQSYRGNEHGDGKEHSEMQKGKFFDGFHMNYYDAPMTGNGVDHHQNHHQHHYMGDGTEYTNYMFVAKDFDPFSEMLNSGKHFHLHDNHHNNNAFLYPKGFSVTNPLDEKMGKQESIINYEEGGDNYPLRGFMDSQNLFRHALRKTSFFSIGGNSNGYHRKDSMDLF